MRGEVWSYPWLRVLCTWILTCVDMCEHAHTASGAPAVGSKVEYLEHRGCLAGGQVPHPGRKVITARGQLPPVGAKGDASDILSVALKG